jgi:hypothetical protein
MATVTPRAIVWTTTAGAKTTGSFTPAVGELLVAIVGIATSDTAPTMSDTDATITGWTLVDSFRSQAATGGLRVYLSNQGASGSAITVTMTPTADAGGGLAVLSVSDPAAFGASGARTTGGQADQAAGGTPAPVLGLTPLASNPVIVAVMNNTNGSANLTPRTGYSEAYDQGFATPATGIEVHYRDSGETSATLTAGSTTPTIFASIAVEINAMVRSVAWEDRRHRARKQRMAPRPGLILGR